MDLTLLGGSLYLVCGLAIFLLGLLVYRESPEVRLHRVSAMMLLFGGLGPILAGLGILLGWGGGEIEPGPGGSLLTGFAYVWELFFPSLLLFALVFPTEQPVLRRLPRLPAVLFAPHAFHLLLLVGLGLFAQRDWGFDVRAMPGGEGAVGTGLSYFLRFGAWILDLLTRLHIRFFSFINFVYAAVALGLLAVSWYRLRSPKLRRQLTVLLFGLGSCMGLYVLAVPLPNVLNLNWPEGVRRVLVSFALLFGTGSIAFAIVRQSFLDLGTVMRRAILLSAISGGLVILYLLTARPMDRILLEQIGRELPVFQTLFLILVVVFFHPILGRVETAVDRLVHGSREGHGNLLRRLGRDMTTLLDLPVLTATLRSSLEDALALESVDVVLLDPGSGRYRDETGERVDLDPAHAVVRRIAETRDPVAVRDLVDETPSREDRDEINATLGALGTRFVVPIQLPEGAGCMGFLALGTKLTGTRLNAEEVTVLSILSTQVGIAIRNARLHADAVARKIVDQELAMARSIQEAILARGRPSLEGLDVAAVSLPSRHVGGDYYDVIPLAEGRLGVAIGDVSGKGIPAALLMSMLHAGLHAQVNGSVAVGEVARRMNQILYHSTSHEKYATFFFGVYDPKDRAFLYANAGHNTPLLLGADGSVRRLTEGGLVLGVMEDAGYREASVPVTQGDLLVLYTDGVTEAEGADAEEYGESRLIETVRACAQRPSEEIVRAVRRDVAAFAGQPTFTDDFTLIVVRLV